MKEANEILKDKDINPSVQRLRILKFMNECEEHPTAERIYNEICEEIPTLSKTTVYNTMELFMKKGIVVGICLGQGELRFDMNVEPHAHFRCLECNGIYDIDMDSQQIFSLSEIDGHQVKGTSVYFTGICKNCRDSE